MRMIFGFSCVLILGCGPRDVIPDSPNHPANPGAPVPSQTVVAAPPDAGQAATLPASPHEHHDHAAEPSAPDVDANQDVAAAEQAAYARAKPVFDKFCAKCHAKAGAKATAKKLGHFSIDTYPFGGHHAATIGATVREVLGDTGKEPTMPDDNPGAVKGADLDAILAWSKAFDRAHAAGLHHHGGDAEPEHHHDHGGH